jgi:hypothetical protein
MQRCKSLVTAIEIKEFRVTAGINRDRIILAFLPEAQPV